MKRRFALLVCGLMASFLLVGPSSAANFTIRFAEYSFALFWQADQNSDIEAKVLRNDMVLVHKCERGMCYVSHPRSTKTGYVIDAFRARPEPSAFPDRPTEGFGRVERFLNIRSLPTLGSVALGEVHAGVRVKRDNCKGDYCYVFIEGGNQGWIAKNGIAMDRVVNVERLPNAGGLDSVWKGTPRDIDLPKVNLFP
ncbi:SH3 domain-containing protein [Devosia faecipullorum]|uniref:SH3 domain-containing protein n=1 Tax=Devosia faecipullorum TaxID=2755039 RepID=UPI00187BBE3C|nr:SH3 domain-containing protein [Devosia faecipullorum]MBE7732319.1 hypothetical protein [Devosia faecipullorum]